MNMFANRNLQAAFEKQAEKSCNATTSLVSVMYNRTPMTSRHHQAKMVTPQHHHQDERTSSPTCVISQHIPIEHADQELSGSMDHHLGEFYNQATWRMYERIQSARRELNYERQPMLPSLDDNQTSSRQGIPRLHQRRRDSLNQLQQQQDDHEDYLEDAIFEMDL